MVVSLTYRQVLRRVRFPVYALDTEDFYIRDGLLLVNELVVDDKNQSGSTLGMRRLQTPHKLKRMSKVYNEFLDLVKFPSSVLIDTNGAIFEYTKTKFEKCVSLEIKKKELFDTHTRVWLKGVNFPFILERPPTGKNWAQVLYMDSRPWLLYSLSEEKLESSKRKI